MKGGPDSQLDNRITTIYAELQNWAEYIAHKVEAGIADDIKPEYLQQIIEKIQEVENISRPSPHLMPANLETLIAIKRQCYGARMFYFDKNDPANYIATLEDGILPLLQTL